jgi:hypothetical protein
LVKRPTWLLILVPIALAVAFAIRSSGSEPRIPPPAPAANSGVSCFRQGGDPGYCRCLDRLESARATIGRDASGLPSLDHPTIRYALRHPKLYPIINSDTLRCLTPPPPRAPGVTA